MDRRIQLVTVIGAVLLVILVIELVRRRRLNERYALLWMFIVVPWFIRDAVYRLIARNRYRWFGREEACRIPTPELRARFL